jgi:hypothetical protein
MKIVVLDLRRRLCLLRISTGILLLVSRLLRSQIKRKGFDFLEC